MSVILNDVILILRHYNSTVIFKGIIHTRRLRSDPRGASCMQLLSNLGRSNSVPQVRSSHPSSINLLKKQINSGKGKKMGDVSQCGHVGKKERGLVTCQIYLQGSEVRLVSIGAKDMHIWAVTFKLWFCPFLPGLPAHPAR